jgi:hypothetical protein
VPKNALVRWFRKLAECRHQTLFAILDAARAPNTPYKLLENRARYCCLFPPAPEESLEDVAPYLLEIESGAPILDWMAGEGWGDSWGIYFTAEADLRTVVEHFQGLTIVQDQSGRRMYFRFYDPRVFRVYLPTCTLPEARAIFGPVNAFYLEPSDKLTHILRFTLGERGAEQGLLDPAGEIPQAFFRFRDTTKGNQVKQSSSKENDAPPAADQDDVPIKWVFRK